MSPTTDVKYVTLSNDGSQGDREFVFACKGRPFVVLTAPNFPTPATTLMDYTLVRDLNLRMSDLQCSKFNYGGQKLRILGKISTSVQCITSGAVSGNLHLKALVIQDLYQSFDVHAIAGDKLSSKLIGSPFALSPETETEPTTPTKKKRKRTSQTLPSIPSTPSPSKSRSSNSSPISTNSSAKKSPARSPPGFPSSPMFSYSPRPALPMQPTNQRSPLSVNIARFTAAFGSADLIDGLEEEQDALAKTDPNGRTNYGYSSDGSFELYGSRDHTRGPLYRSGHGRLWCSRTCRASIDPPHNCGHHTQWQLPAGFQPCGHLCKGGLCDCIRGSADYGYYG